MKKSASTPLAVDLTLSSLVPALALSSSSVKPLKEQSEDKNTVLLWSQCWAGHLPMARSCLCVMVIASRRLPLGTSPGPKIPAGYSGVLTTSVMSSNGSTSLRFSWITQTLFKRPAITKESAITYLQRRWRSSPSCKESSFRISESLIQDPMF